MKWIKKIFIYSFLAVVTLVITAIVLARVYEPEIKAHFIKQLNNYLATEVKVQDYKVSLLRSFPYASLEFRNVTIKESIPESDRDFAQVESVFLLFNVMDMFRGKYEIEKVRVANGEIWVRIDPLNRPNYELFKESPEGSSDDFALDVSQIDLLNVKVNYADFPAKQNFVIDAQKITASGRFGSEKYDLAFNGDMHVLEYIIDDIAYLRDKKVWVNTNLQIDNAENLYSIKKGQIRMGGASFVIDGHFQQKENGMYSDLKITASETGINTLLALVPDAYLPKFNDYEHSGRIYFDATIKGLISSKENPLINVSFGIDKGRIKNRKNGMALENVNFKGSFTNGNLKKASSSVLAVNDFTGSLNGKDIIGFVELSNFDFPAIKTAIKTDVDLADVDRFFDIPGFDEVSGNLSLDVAFQGRISDLKQTSTLHRTSSTGKVIFTNMNLRPKDSYYRYSKMDGQLTFNGSDLVIKDFKGFVLDNDFLLNGSFRNFTSWLFLPDQELQIDASLRSTYIDLDKLLYSPQGPAADSAVLVSFPENLRFNFNMAVGGVTFEKFKAENFTGTVKYSGKKAELVNVRANTMKGSVVLNGTVEERGKKFFVQGTANGNQIDIQQFFGQMGNFGQEFLTDKHLRGNLQTNIIFSGAWNNDLSPDLNRMEAVADMRIRNGELIEFEPITEMAGFIKLRKLRHLKFDELKNRVIIKNNIITIPEMDLTNTAMAMSVSGTHSFDNDYTYRIKLNLSDLLFGAEDQFDSRFGEVVPSGGGLNMYLLMTGNNDNIAFKYDKQAVQQNFAQGVKEERKELRDLFAREFGRNKEPQGNNEFDDDEEELTIEFRRSSGTQEKPESRTQKDRRNAYQQFWQKVKEEL